MHAVLLRYKRCKQLGLRVVRYLVNTKDKSRPVTIKNINRKCNTNKATAFQTTQRLSIMFFFFMVIECSQKTEEKSLSRLKVALHCLRGCLVRECCWTMNTFCWLKLLTQNHVESNRRRIHELQKFNGNLSLRAALTVWAKIFIFFQNIMLEAVSGQPCMRSRWIRPIRYADFFHVVMNTTLHSTRFALR